MPILRTVKPSPPKRRKLILHCGHHKVATKWFQPVLADIADEFGLEFQFRRNNRQAQVRESTDIFFEAHSWVDRSKLRPYVGSHIIRDPRDVIISGYFYHQWTDETWCNKPRKKLGGRSYRQHLSSLSTEDGIAFEMREVGTRTVRDMANWDFDDPAVLEIKYEDLLADPERVFTSVFRKYEFDNQQVKGALEIADRYSFKSLSGREPGDEMQNTHLRRGLPGDWKNYFTDKLRKLFKRKFGDVLTRLGYEQDDNW